MNINQLPKNICFWIIIFFLIRLVGITNPPLEVGHNWRQTTVAMVSRNYLEIDPNIFFPRIDIGGEKTGITGMEFPIFNYIIFIIAKLFGYQHWYGRLINLIISSIGLWFFYKLIYKYFTHQIAFNSTIILAASVWFQFSRKIMPDTFSMSLIIACIYYGSNYLENNNIRYRTLYLVSYVGLISLGLLSKLPSGFLLIIFGFFIFNSKISPKRKIIFIIFSFLAFIPVIIWYYYWVPFLVKKYEFWHFFMGKSLREGFSEIVLNLNETLSRFYDTALKFIGFAVFILGLVFSILLKDRKIYFLLLLTFFSFCVFIFKAGYNFPHHNYYIIPFVPIMALIAGYGLTNFKNRKIAALLLVGIVVEGIANQHQDFRIKDIDKGIVNLEEDLDKVSLKNDLIIINSGNHPTPMYFAHRKGWVSDNDQIKDEKHIESLKDRGLKYAIILKKSFGTDISLPQYKKVLENDNYSIYRL